MLNLTVSVTVSLVFCGCLDSVSGADFEAKRLDEVYEAAETPAQGAKSAAAEEFGLADAQRLADARRRELHGECGKCTFKERIGDAWTFSVKIGYAGSPAPDITVFPPTNDQPPSPNKKPSQSSQPVGGAR